MARRSKIFTLDYLVNNEYTEDDLYFLFETPSLLESLIIAEFRIAGYKESDKDIKRIARQKDWMYSRFFTDKQRERFIRDLTTIYKKMYWSNDIEAKSRAEMWYVQYGFTNSNVRKNKKIGKICE